MRLVQLVKDKPIIDKILAHLTPPTNPPPVAAARPPPQAELDWFYPHLPARRADGLQVQAVRVPLVRLRPPSTPIAPPRSAPTRIYTPPSVTSGPRQRLAPTPPYRRKPPKWGLKFLRFREPSQPSAGAWRRSTIGRAALDADCDRTALVDCQQACLAEHPSNRNLSEPCVGRCYWQDEARVYDDGLVDTLLIRTECDDDLVLHLEAKAVLVRLASEHW